MDRTEIIAHGREVIQIELESVQQVLDRIDDSFARAVEMIAQSEGRVIITGMGKSGIIGKKIAATMTSVGTMAIFLHPAEGIHGDLGLVTSQDIIIAISKSGETMELNRLVPVFRRYNCRIIAMTGNPDSHLARFADVVLDISVNKEACPFDLAPTSSSTVTLVLGDALAITLLQAKHFQLADFARNHPGGSIGRSLLTVADLMHSGSAVPIITIDTPMRDALLEMTSKRLGVTTVVDSEGRLAGIITDGDLRRWLARSADPMSDTAASAMVHHPKTITRDRLALEAVEMMEHYAITALIVVDDDRPEGVIHLHDLVKSGVVYRGKGHRE